MRRLKVPLSILFLVFLAVDMVVAYRLWVSGWPKRIGLAGIQEGVEQVQVTPISFTGADWLILVAVISIHALVCYLVWKAWHSSPVGA